MLNLWPCLWDGSTDSMTKCRYQPGGSSGFNGGSDPLSNGTICLRDAALMQQLGVNTIRVYNLDPTVNHDECASVFNAVGIYMLLDVNSPLGGESLVPGAQLAGSYDAGYLQHIFAVVEAFKDYDNTLGFIGGNEDMVSKSPSISYPSVNVSRSSIQSVSDIAL